MDYIADLHIHSPYSRATSKLSHLHGLAAWAAIKGIQVVGTGDFTHPEWLDHLKKHLQEAEPGFFRLKKTSPELFSNAVPEGLVPDITEIRFVLTSEISSIYKRGDRVRKIHNILFAPDFDSVHRINTSLSAIGNLESDGRPILGLDSRNLLEILLEKAPEGFLVPAHIWTPWFSLFGSKSGFDSIDECFGDLTGHIFALETGLSSDPDMNRTISALDRFSLISNSDCHSPSKLGREANLFSTDFDFFSMRDALKQPLDKRGQQLFTGTIEFYPEEGKYHCDGHRKCKVCMEPQETRKNNGICPACGKPVTVGVLYRVMELADRTKPVYQKGAPAVYSLVPLQELLGELLQVGAGSKRVLQNYIRLIQQFGSEFSILLDTDIKDIERYSSSHLAEAIDRVRNGKVIRKPGYDGEFGVIQVFSESERKNFGGQKSLFVTEDSVTPKKTSRMVKKIDPLKQKTQEQSIHPKELNQEQKEIVNSDAHHILVKAGPGTGKTHTLIQRVVRITTVSPGQPCTVITFTNKAANELTERLEAILGSNHTVHVSTLHGYCLQWLRKDTPELKVASPDMRRRLLKKVCGKNVARIPDGLDKEVTSFLQQAPGMRKSYPSAVQAYFELLRSENLVDMDGVIPAFNGLLHGQNAISTEIRKKTGHLFIDEFQDLNKSQYEMIRLLAESSPVFAIGDPDQAIYGFRGSSPKWFYTFSEELKPQHYSLYRNYRSATKIVEASNSVIAHNHQPGEAITNRSESKECGQILFHTAKFPGHEVQFVVQQIEMLVGGTSHREIDRLSHLPDTDSITLADIAVLYRTTRQAEIVASTLQKHGLPIQVVDIVPYYLKSPIRSLYHSLLLLTDLAEIDQVLGLLSDAGLGEGELQTIDDILSSEKGETLDLLCHQVHLLPPKVIEQITALVDLREKIASPGSKTDVRFVVESLAQEYALDEDEPNFVRFLKLAGNFGSDLDGFVQHLILYNDSVVYDKRAETLTLMTLHAAKGLEFKVVFIIGAEEGFLPLSYKDNLNEDQQKLYIEEERRLFYVGLTRAKQILYLSHVQMRGKDEQKQHPSRFLQEIPSTLITILDKKLSKRKTRKKVKQLSLFDKL